MILLRFIALTTLFFGAQNATAELELVTTCTNPIYYGTTTDQLKVDLESKNFAYILDRSACNKLYSCGPAQKIKSKQLVSSLKSLTFDKLTEQISIPEFSIYKDVETTNGIAKIKDYIISKSQFKDEMGATFYNEEATERVPWASEKIRRASVLELKMPFNGSIIRYVSQTDRVGESSTGVVLAAYTICGAEEGGDGCRSKPNYVLYTCSVK